MLSRMIARLLLKTILGLALLLGVASYGHHLSGGDPGALWSRVAGGAANDVAESFGKLRGTLDAPVAALTGADSRSDSVFTWRDDHGVTHFTSAPPPVGVDAEIVSVNPDTNVLVPVVAPKRVRGRPADGGVPSGDLDGTTGRERAGATRGAGGADDFGEPLPGIGGAVLRARGDAPAFDPERAAALLKLLTPTR